ASLRLDNVERPVHERDDSSKLFTVACPVVPHVRLITPGRDAGVLHGKAHRTSMIRAIEEKPPKKSGVSGRTTGTQPRCARPLGKAREHDEIVKVVSSQLVRRFESAKRWGALVTVDFRVTLVGRNHEAVLVGEFEESLPLLEREHATGRIAR